MNTLLTSTLALAAMFVAPFAQADDKVYLGGAVGQRSTLTLSTDGAQQKAINEPRSFNLHAGYEWNEHVAMEAGYTRFGKYRFAGGENISLDTLYVAAKGSVALSDRFSVFGRAGIAQHTLKLAGSTADDGKYGKARPMFGAGVAYRVSEQVALKVEVVDYGTLRTGGGDLKLRQFEAGLDFRF
jgi:OOP family OmpA-OmpF porin